MFFHNLKIFASAFFCLISLLCLSPTHSYAYVDDAKVLSGLDTYKVPGDIYLNTHDFHYIGKASYKPGWGNGKTYYHDYGAYISKDGSIITIWFEDKNRLGNIYFVKPGPKTDKGIEVGMNVSDIEKKYGKIFTAQEVKARRAADKNFSVFNYNAGEYLDFPRPTGNYTGYQEIEFVSNTNEGLSFIINKHNNKIVLIRYKANRKGSTFAYQDVFEEFPMKLLPELR